MKPRILIPIGLGLALAFFVFVLSNRSTFGQRCERMYPNAPTEQERCVRNLASGVRP